MLSADLLFGISLLLSVVNVWRGFAIVFLFTQTSHHS